MDPKHHSRREYETLPPLPFLRSLRYDARLQSSGELPAPRRRCVPSCTSRDVKGDATDTTVEDMAALTVCSPVMRYRQSSPLLVAFVIATSGYVDRSTVPGLTLASPRNVASSGGREACIAQLPPLSRTRPY